MTESGNWKGVAAVGVLAIVALWWWNAQPEPDSRTAASQTAECRDVASAALNQVRAGDTAGTINEKMDWLSRNCDEEYDALTGYWSATSSIAQFGTDSCDVWAGRVGDAAADFLRADGLCTAGVADPHGAAPDGSIPWEQAASFAGQTQQVCGPLASIRNSTDDVFVNVGLDYPDVDRFTIVLWDVGGVESLPAGTMVCASGPITLYQGVAQIELRDVSAVKVRAG